MEKIKGIDVVKMATEFHKVYELESIYVGWKTQEECKVPFDKLPEQNKKVMLRTCARMIEWINKNQEDV